jgi:rhamnogalacturonyl hydrolase YesR
MCILGIALSAGLLAAPDSAWAQHVFTPEELAAIAKDNARHFGDDPDQARPPAKLKPALKPKFVRQAIRKVADWQLARSQPYFDQLWTSGALYAGFLAASQATGDPKYRDTVRAMGEQFHWQLRTPAANPDNQCLAQAYLELYRQERQQKMLAAVQDEFDALAALPPDAEHNPWWWCDTLFMAPPAWARMYAATNDRKYLDYLNREWWTTSGKLYDQQEHLYFRDAGFFAQREANGRKMFWSRGNGWVMAGMVRVLQFLPRDYPDRPRYLAQFRDMAARVAELQGPDGLWRAGLLDPEYYGLPENSGSAFFVYALAWGINEGILDRHGFQPVVAKAWKGLLAHIYADGRLGCIQQTGDAPSFYKPTASYNYGVGAFLLAGSEVLRLAQENVSRVTRAAF